MLFSEEKYCWHHNDWVFEKKTYTQANCPQKNKKLTIFIISILSYWLFLFILFKMKKVCNWTDQEDKLLLDLYDQVDCFQKWKFISQNFKKMGFHKSQIQCRERYVNKLNPELRQDKLEVSQLKDLFEYYDQYGPLWSVFESLIPGRNQNLLKNKFYSTLRSLVRILIASSQKNSLQKSSFSSTSLSSKLLVEIYEGKKSFRKYKGVFRAILNKMNFQLELEKAIEIKNQLNFQIVEKIKQEISKTKTSTKKNKTLKNSNKQSYQNCPKIIYQEQKIPSGDTICKESRQMPLEIQNGHESFQNKGPTPQLSIFSFYVTQLNSLNFYVPFLKLEYA